MIFNYNNYIDVLKDYLKKRPNRGHGESKKIADFLRVSSTYVSHILSGQKVLSLEQAELMTEYLGLKPLETEYFFLLVEFERAGSQRLKKFFENKIEEVKVKALKLSNRLQVKKVFSDQERSIFYSNPLYSAIHLFTSTQTKGRTVDEIASRFEITRLQASQYLNFLLEASLVNEFQGFYSMGVQSTHLENNSPHLARHHCNWRLRSIQAAENLKEKELMYTVNVSLSEKDFAKLREEMVGFIKTFLEKVHASPAEDVACFNLDFFWIRK